jgi:hypothetical protein
MSIRQQVEDGTFLAKNGRHLGALTILLVAIAASARKCFPKGTKSFENPAESMGDREAFTVSLVVRFGNFCSAVTARLSTDTQAFQLILREGIMTSNTSSTSSIDAS